VTTYIIRRLIQALVIVIIVSLLVFLSMHFLPGDPLLTFIGQSNMMELDQESLNNLRHEFGLDKSLPVQYISWVTGLFQGDFGISITYHDEVSKLIAERLPVTLYLGVLAFILSFIFGILAGVFAAIRRGRWLDSLMTFLANIGITIPVFWLGILMIYLFGLKLAWLPLLGFTSPFEDFWFSTQQLIMPVICLGVVPLASTARQTRSSMLEVLRQDYVRTAWSKGLKEKEVIMRHALKNSLIPIITLTGMHIPVIFGGSVLIETVFNIPGMGRLMVNAVLAQDFPIVNACFLLIATIVVLANLLVDVSYSWIDPRIRYG
jgi:peptide/nickel transport system permease protein